MEGTQSPPIHVVADHREADGGVVEALRQIPDVQVTVARLAVGDYLVENRCLFERKSLVDFAASIKDGRLFAQAHRLAAAPQLAAIILEGRAADLVGSQMRREALQGAILSLSLIFGLPVLRSLEPAETARLMLYAAQQLRRCGQGAVANHGVRPKSKRKRQLRVLQSLPAIGPRRAEQLLASFGSVQAVVIADAQALQTVDGIGAKTAAAIREVLQDAP
jgi:ERCC4-type nuclease